MLKAGFDPAYLYELVFTAKDPLVLGIGFAATRDLNSFLRYAEKDDEGNANPVAKKISWAVSQGNSQSGNFIRSYIHLGFNQDEAGRIVFDGANPHIAGRQLALNFRFAVGGGVANRYEPGSEAVLWWSDYPDEVRHRPPPIAAAPGCSTAAAPPTRVQRFSRLSARSNSGTCACRPIWSARMPKPIFRSRIMSAVIISPAPRMAAEEAVSAPRQRRFQMAASFPRIRIPQSDTMRALTADLIEWVTKGREPPASRYPRLDRGELVQPTATGFPRIPGAPSPDGLINTLPDYDFGPGFKYNDLSGVITIEPPGIKRMIPLLVPKVNKDGNDEAGVPSVLLQNPLGTYTGWNVTRAGFNKGQICGLNGAYIPFAKTKAERVASGDPRLSLEERYGSHEAYVAKVKAATEQAVKGRFLLQVDADRLIAQAEASDVLAAK